MKKRIVKLSGVGLVLILLASLLVAAIPASAAVQAWGMVVTPGVAYNQVAPADTDVTALKVASNGDLFCVDTSGATNIIYKSGSGGLYWTAAVILPAPGPATIVDVAISPGYTTDLTVFALAAGTAALSPQVYRSTDGGITFTQFGDMSPVLNAVTEIGTSIAVSPTYSGGVGEIMVGTQDPTAATFGDVYVWALNGVQVWTRTNIAGGAGGAGDVTTVAYSPRFAVDQVRLGVITGAAGTGTLLRAMKAQEAWDATLGVATVNNGTTEVGVAGATDIVRSSLALPSDYDARSALTRTCYVSIVSGLAADDVYRMITGYNVITAGTAGTAMAPLSGALFQPAGGDEICTSLAYYGTTASGTLYAGANAFSTVVVCANPTANALALTWSGNFVAPSGGGGLTYVATSPDGATVYAGTSGADSALSASTDGGVYFTQMGLIDTDIAAIQDFTPVDASNYFLLTSDTDSETIYYQITNCAGATVLAWGDDGGGAATFNVTYTNQAGVGGQITPNFTIAAGTLLNAIVAIPLAAGDTGIQAIAAVTEVGGPGGDAGDTFDIISTDTATNYGTFTSGGAWVGTGNPTPAGADSLWATADGGLTWTRPYSVALTGGTGIVRVSPDYATDLTVVVGDLAAANVYVANDGGHFFMNFAITTGVIAITDMAVADMLTFYASGAAGGNPCVQATTNGGWIWQAAATVVTDAVWGNGVGANTVQDLELDLGTGDLLAGLNNGQVMKSTDANTTWAWMWGGAPNSAMVAFGDDYATSGMIYAVGTAGATADVLRYATGYSAWLATGSGIAAATAGDVLVAPDGTLYCSDTTAANGMSRSINPDAGTSAISTAGWNNAIGVGLTAGVSTITLLSYAPGSNIIYGIDAALNLIYSYTDEVSASSTAPVAASPAEGEIVNPPNAWVTTNTIAPVPSSLIVGGYAYQVQWNTRADFLGPIGNAQALPFPTYSVLLQTPYTSATAGVDAIWGSPDDTPEVLAGDVPYGTTIYYRVRVNVPVIGPWSSAISFETELAPDIPNAPEILGPYEGGTNYNGWDANINPTFQWGPITGATGYEFKLATDAALSNLLVDLTGTNALGVVNAYTLTSMTLDYNTTYYWTVRAIGTGTTNAWATTVAFTTMAAPAATEAPVTVTDSTITVEIPTQTSTELVIESTEISSAYIWVIIAIGAILVIAVIVLIVRTRRST